MPFKPVAHPPTQQEIKKAKLDRFRGKNPTIEELIDMDCAPKTKKALDFLLNSKRETYRSERNALVAALCDAISEDFNELD